MARRESIETPPPFLPATDMAAEIQFSAVPGGTPFRLTYSTSASALDNYRRLLARGVRVLYTRGF